MPARLISASSCATHPPAAGQGITTGVLQSQELGRLLGERREAAGGDLAAALRGLPNVSGAAAMGLPTRLALCAGSAHLRLALPDVNTKRCACLAHPLPSVQVFQRRASQVVEGPWQLAISEDGRFPGTEANFPIPTTAALLRCVPTHGSACGWQLPLLRRKLCARWPPVVLLQLAAAACTLPMEGPDPQFTHPPPAAPTSLHWPRRPPAT